MHAVSVVVEASREDEASVVLWDEGCCGVEVKAGSRGEIELLAYFEEPPDLARIQAALPEARLSGVPVPEVDWVSRFREGFRPFQAGRFRVTPRWEARGPSSDVLIVDPGRAFGTGTHETTRLCLDALAELAARRPLGRTLDLGCGTGLLAIAARRLGAGPVIASDIDPEATASALVHARLNAAELAVVRADGGGGFRPGSFDLVLANLMALLLIDRAGEVQALVAPGGSLVLSGLLRGDVPPVREAFAASGTPRVSTRGEWAALTFGSPA